MRIPAISKNPSFGAQRWVFGVILMVVTRAEAWDCYHHQLVAEIAFQSSDTATRAELRQILASGPVKTLRSAACWPDWIKQRGVHDYDAWHYIDIPDVHGAITPLPIAEENVLSALQKNYAVLANSNTLDVDRAFALSFVTHLVGDIHQPLHCISRYDSRFPQGDRGGNLYQIAIGVNAYESLHWLWDQGLSRPPNALNSAAIRREARALMARWPAKRLKKLCLETRFERWADESFKLAHRYVYQTPYSLPMSEKYVVRAQKIVARQLCLAGYRLAVVLKAAMAKKL